MEKLVSLFYEKYAATATDSVRSFIDTIDWDNRFIGIKGSRGVGKTTVVLQYIKLNYKPDKRVLYVSLDHLYFLENTLYDLVADFYKKGGEFIAIDTSLSRLQAGDLCLILIDQVDEALAHIAQRVAN